MASSRLRRLVQGTPLAGLFDRTRTLRPARVADPPATVPHWTGPTHGGDARRATVATAIARPLADHRQPARGPVPGEVVWTFLPGAGSRLVDRPVLVLGRIGGDVLALGAVEERPDDGVDGRADAPGDGDRGRLDLTGTARLPTELALLRIDRALALEPGGVRRAGVVLDGPTLRRVLAAWRAW